MIRKVFRRHQIKPSLAFTRPTPRSALSLATKVTTVGALVSVLEELSRPNEMHDHGLFSWPIRRSGLRLLANKTLSPVLRVFEHPKYQKAVALRGVAAAGALLSPSGSWLRTASLVSLSALLLGKSYRSAYGSDGSDQMTFITTTLAAAEAMPGLRPHHRQLLAGFLTFQSTLSYFSAGVAKLYSSPWRDGSAVKGIFRTKTYGDEDLYNFLIHQRWAAKGLSWLVIIAETTFPLVLILPPLPRRVTLGLAAVFHIGNARFMGLNRFFWAFLGTYPVVDHSADVLQSMLKKHDWK